MMATKPKRMGVSESKRTRKRAPNLMPLSPSFAQCLRQMLWRQATFTLLLIAGAFALAFFGDAGNTVGEQNFARAWLQAKALALGGVLGIVTTAISARSVLQSSRATHLREGSGHSSALGKIPLFSGMLWRIILLTVGAWLGIKHFALPPLALALGYSTMLFAYFGAAVASVSEFGETSQTQKSKTKNAK